MTATATQCIVVVSRKDVDELGLNRSEASAFNAVIDAAAADELVEGVFLDITDGDHFRGQLQQLLPEHEGGVFETVTTGSRALARYLKAPNAPFQDEGNWGYWVKQAILGTSKQIGRGAGRERGYRS